MNPWTRRYAGIRQLESGDRMCEFRFTRRDENGSIVERNVQFSRKGEPGLTAEDYERADVELSKKEDQ